MDPGSITVPCISITRHDAEEFLSAIAPELEHMALSDREDDVTQTALELIYRPM